SRVEQSDAVVLCSVYSFVRTLPAHLFSRAVPPADTYPLSLHDALPICTRTPSSIGSPDVLARSRSVSSTRWRSHRSPTTSTKTRSEEHTSELQSRENLVCRLLLEKKKTAITSPHRPGTCRMDTPLLAPY